MLQNVVVADYCIYSVELWRATLCESHMLLPQMLCTSPDLFRLQM